MDSFTYTERGTTLVPDKIDLDEITKGLDKVWQDWHNSFVDSFKGVPVRVDESLEGGQYYIGISRELYERLKVETPSPVPLQVPERPLEA